MTKRLPIERYQEEKTRRDCDACGGMAACADCGEVNEFVLDIDAAIRKKIKEAGGVESDWENIDGLITQCAEFMGADEGSVALIVLDCLDSKMDYDGIVAQLKVYQSKTLGD